ncbi:restriction endonuclease [Vibrio fluvialis]|uniref:restriction endonuclease n=1 Tax=Vibrio fluvialis TaxID=676 RepID=UPI00192B44B6|nr:restriction endonuclease [Vibrio fluvialis]MBL4276954.1 restriction endonuclease [Vibrio fluvialis]
MELRKWQQKFVDAYVESDAQKSLLIAATGTGKTITALTAAKKKLENGDVSNLVVISDRKVIQDQWKHVARDIDIKLDMDVTSLGQGTSLTYQFINNHQDEFLELIHQRDTLIIYDEVYRYNKKSELLTDLVSAKNTNSKFLYLSSLPIKDADFDWQHEMGREFIFQPNIIELPESKIEIVSHAPSISLLQKLQRNKTTLDDLSWRQFEKLISELLESDGYEVELMKGTKDGGVDIVAVKNMREAGFYKTLWQAKKNRIDNKVGISTIRELADVRNEFGASKGILVTSSFLTRGALERVYRDRYILGKVDRDDINTWINRKLFE